MPAAHSFNLTQPVPLWGLCSLLHIIPQSSLYLAGFFPSSESSNASSSQRLSLITRSRTTPSHMPAMGYDDVSVSEGKQRIMPLPSCWKVSSLTTQMPSCRPGRTTTCALTAHSSIKCSFDVEAWRSRDPILLLLLITLTTCYAIIGILILMVSKLI